MERAPGGPIGNVAPPHPDVKVGTVIAEKYRVEKELGRGGFGVVVRARHLAIDQLVAIKVLTPGDGGDQGWRQDAARFKREAQATAALRSEHVVRVLDADFLESGAPYIVMEHLEGETLHNAIHTRSLTVGEAVDHAVEVLAALGEAHAAGIVHRDLKPANVLITMGAGGTPVVKVLDFGVSKVGQESAIGQLSAASDPITKTGTVIGTIAYMAPEQMSDAKRVDGRADLWSVGVILFELLTKQLPFGPANAASTVTAMLTSPPASLSALRPDVPPKLEKVVMRLLEKVPERRYATAAAVAASLAALTTPRACAALDSLRRVGEPTGAAAPGGARGSAGCATASGAALESRPRMRPIVLVVTVVGTLATIAMFGLALGLLLAEPKLPQGAPATTDAGALRG